MLIYAIFLCFQATQSCQPVSAPQYVDGMYIPAKVYDSQPACQSALLKWYAGGWKGKRPNLDGKGRYMLGDSGAFYVCLRRRVTTWH